MMRRALEIIAPGITALGLVFAAPVLAAAGTPKILIYPFEMVNTSPAPDTSEEKARLGMIFRQIGQALQESGQYDVTDNNKAVQALADVASIRGCNGCELAPARAAGADLAAYGWVQKVSNLILNINFVIEDAKTGAPVRRGSVDIRGNTDVSWTRGARYLLEEHILTPDAAGAR